MKTIYLTEKQLARLHIDLSVFPNQGPRPNITGLKRLYWGKDAYCVKVGQYVYKVTQKVYEMAKSV